MNNDNSTIDMTINVIAAAYTVDADALYDTVNAIRMEYNFFKCDLPKPTEDIIPLLIEFSQKLLTGCNEQGVLDRLIATAQAYDDKDFVESEDYVTEMTESLERLARLLAHVPLHGGKRPMDVNEFFAVRKLCKFWEAQPKEGIGSNGKLGPIDRKLTEKFSSGEASSKGGAFVCDVIECVIAEARPFKRGNTTLDESNEYAAEVRASVSTQLRNYVNERRSASNTNITAE